jgi:hypothetical protein
MSIVNIDEAVQLQKSIMFYGFHWPIFMTII